MEYHPINFDEKFEKVPPHWLPRVVAELNDYQFKLTKVLGEFVWHSHEDSDEAFLVMDGMLTIQFRDGEVKIGPGEMFVVPKGVEHRPVAETECRILVIEPRGVVNTGGAGGDLTAENDVWV